MMGALERRSSARIALLACVVWISHYALATHFGLWADDWELIAPFINDTFAQSFHTFGDRIRFLTSDEGRPLEALLPGIAGLLIGATRSFVAGYVVGAVIVTTNVELLWRLTRRVSSAGVAWGVALAYVLSPVDLTRPLLEHPLILQLSVMFVLIGISRVAEGRIYQGVLIGSLALLVYETPFLLMAGAPLLSRDGWSRRRWIHYLPTLLAALFAVALLRAVLGENRLTQSVGIRPAILVFWTGAGLIIGPLTSFVLAVCGPLRWVRLASLGTVTTADFPIAYLTLNALVAAAGVAVCARLRLWQRVRDLFTAGAGESGGDGTARIATIGGVLLPISYGLSFTHFPPTTSAGIHMSTHIGASVAMAMILGATGAWCWSAADRRKQLLGRSACALYLGGMFTTCLAVQREYARAWDLHQKIYQGVLLNVAGLDEQTRVVINVSEPFEPFETVPAHDYFPEVLGMMIVPIPGDTGAARIAWPQDPEPYDPRRWYHRLEPAWYRGGRLSSPSAIAFQTPRARRRADGALEWRPDFESPEFELIGGRSVVRMDLRNGRLLPSDSSVTIAGLTIPTGRKRRGNLGLSRLGEIVMKGAPR